MTRPIPDDSDALRVSPGVIDSEHLFGRRAFIERLWEDLARSSVYLSAPRRAGKTSILMRMRAEPPNGWTSLYASLDDVASVQEFVSRIEATIERDGSIDSYRALIDHWGTGWKARLARGVDQSSRSRLKAVFFLDEFPLMLSSIVEREGADSATELLDTLRYFRQSVPSFRMLITGSIGMHHVLDRIGARTSALNDLVTIELPPLSPASAVSLATKLMRSAGVPDSLVVAKTIADESGGYPYFVHAIVDQLSRHPVAMTGRMTASLLLDDLAQSSDDVFNLSYYMNLVSVYEEPEREMAVSILNVISGTNAPQTLGQLQRALHFPTSGGALERLRSVVRSLVLDFILNRDTSGGYSFRIPLVRRWWAIHVSRAEGSSTPT